MSIWTHELLDALRQIGDPLLDSTDGHPGWRGIAHLEAANDTEGPEQARLLQTWRRCANGALPETVDPEDRFWTDVDDHLDPGRLEIAYSLFVVYGSEIASTLLLASLPNAYAAEAGATVLATTRELRSNARRRIAETSQLVVDVLFPDNERLYTVKGVKAEDVRPSLLPGGRAYVRLRTTRLTHALIRDLLDPDQKAWNREESAHIPRHPETKVGVPINQEDLLGTLGTFTVTVFEVMEKLGVPWNDEAEAAYLQHWDRVGELLGIGTTEVTKKLDSMGVELPMEYHGSLRPKTPAEARHLQEMIRERNWPLPLPGRILGPFAGVNGKLLVRALLDELQSAMPRGLERLPLVVMRYLVHDSAHELLGLGGGGVPDSLLRWPSEQRFTRGARARVGKGLVERGMRVAASDVARRAFIHFIRSRADDESQADFWFPVVPQEFTLIPNGRTTPEPKRPIPEAIPVSIEDGRST